MSEFATDLRQLRASSWTALKSTPRWLGGTSAATPQSWAAVIFASGAALFFVASCWFQLSAAHARWITFPAGLDPSDLSVEDHLYDYYLASEPFLMIPGTSGPFGIGMLLQAAGVVLLTMCLLSLRPRQSFRRGSLQLILGLLLSASCAIVGYESLLTFRNGTPPHESGSTALADTLLTLGFFAAIGLCLLCARRCPALSLAVFFTLGTNVHGYIFACYIVAPLLTFYSSHDTTPGTETVVALSTGISGLLLLVAAWLLVRSRSNDWAAGDQLSEN